MRGTSGDLLALLEGLHTCTDILGTDSKIHSQRDEHPSPNKTGSNDLNQWHNAIIPATVKDLLEILCATGRLTVAFPLEN